MKMAVMAVAVMALAAVGCANEAADPQESMQTQLSTDCNTVINQWMATTDCRDSDSGSESCSAVTCCGGDNDGTSEFVLCGGEGDEPVTCGSWYHRSDSYGRCGEPLVD
jgi:hypothetical protein